MTEGLQKNRKDKVGKHTGEEEKESVFIHVGVWAAISGMWVKSLISSKQSDAFINNHRHTHLHLSFF